MPIESEVIVIGGGLAGLTAAITAAREGAAVRVLSATDSSLTHASGLIDVLGYTPEGRGPLPNPFDVVPELPADHPYSTVGPDAIRAGLALFDDVVGDRYAGGHTPRNALVPTVGGHVKPTARYPRAVAPGIASDARDVLLVGVTQLTGFDAPRIAATLEAAQPPFDVRGITVDFPVPLSADPAVTRFAHLLDRDRTADGAITDIRATLADRIRPRMADEARVGFPAVLGMADHRAVRELLETALDVAVFEVPMGPPSLPGMRLADAMVTALTEAGGRITTGNPVVGFDSADGRVRSVTLDKNGQQIKYAADRFVLATGGLVGKGLDADRTTVREPLFDCHVPQPDDRYDWFDHAAFGDHPFARFGLQVDEALRPLGGDGHPEFANLHAAGSVLGGYDFAAEKSGSGVSLATGVAAGRAATGGG